MPEPRRRRPTTGGRASAGIASLLLLAACQGVDTAAEPAPTTAGSVAPPATTPRRGSAPVVAAVGDIAPPGSGGQRETSDLALSWDPTAVLMLGDMQYKDGDLAHIRKYYDPTWGRLKAITHPVPGNHEYHTGGAGGYFSYFGSQAKVQGASYYSFDIGNWHLIALNSEIGHGPDSAQNAWLQADLARSSKHCVLAYWHSPRFSSGSTHGSDDSMTPFWRTLLAANADVVLSGHEHNYERFAPQDADGQPTSAGIRQFVVGTGGVGLYDFGAPITNSRKRLNHDFGVLKLTLEPRSYAWSYASVSGRVLDQGQADCH
jgi:hypothetical protein